MFSTSNPDQQFFWTYDHPGPTGGCFGDTNAKTLYTGSTAGMTVVITAGQSQMVNIAPTLYTPTHSGSVFNLSVMDGAIYYAADPLLGAGNDGSYTNWGGNMATRIADRLLTAGPSTKILLVPIAVGGTYVAQWNDATAGALNLGTKVAAALLRLQERGLVPHAICWGQGENDGYGGTSQADYQTDLTRVINITRNMGYTGPWFIALETMYAGTPYPIIRAAQAAMVNHSIGIWQGPDIDTIPYDPPTNTYRFDYLGHFNALGQETAAGLWQNAMHLYGPPF